MNDEYTGTRIRLEDLTEDEKRMYFKFESGKEYAIPAKTKHQIVIDGEVPAGIAICRNGRQGFRTYEDMAIYFLCCSTSVGMRFGKECLKESTILYKEPTP